MRAAGITKNTSPITIIVDGVSLLAKSGDTIASALIASGKHYWRLSRHGSHRGLFCGIGQCFECLVTVEGVPNTRACQVYVKDGMVIETNMKSEVIP